MDKPKSFAELSLEELQLRKRKMLGVFIGLGSMMLLTCIVLVVLAIKGKKPALIAVAFCSAITLLPSVNNLRQLDKEIKTRQLK